MYTILIVDDEAKLLEVLSLALENMGYNTILVESAEKALQIINAHEVHLVLSDLRLPGLSGRDLLERLKVVRPDLPVVIMTAYAALKDAVAIIKEGAFDYIVKPFDLSALEATVASALRFYSLSNENKRLRQELGRSFFPEHFIGKSPVFEALRQSIQAVSASNTNVLISGESGTGKELVAKAIHYSSLRADAPLVTINCAAIPESLLESELFGHVKGAFTGATANRSGRFVQADSGTLFLDEIGDMPLALQAKILRCLQERTIEPVGSDKTQSVDVRIIAATNQDLVAGIAAGTFRQDLYYRLNVYPIVMPPLRERKEDISLLANHFATRMGLEMGKKPISFTPEAMQVMIDYPWPGNIRELENCVERLTILAGGRSISPDLLATCAALDTSSKSKDAAGPDLPFDLDRRLEALEREFILQALDEVGGVQVKAAELLHISERSMWHRIKKLGINILNKKEIV